MIVESQCVGHIALNVPGAAGVFEAHDIDYCFSGDRTLREACRRASVPVAQVIAELSALGDSAPRRWESLAPLVAEIVGKHHGYARASIAHLAPLAKKILGHHGVAHPELARVVELFEELVEELEPHMNGEERMLFPTILELAREDCEPEHREALRVKVATMHHDHARLGRILHMLRELTSDYALPEDASRELRIFYTDLERLENDMHEHIHLENNLLLPRALASGVARAAANQ